MTAPITVLFPVPTKVTEVGSNPGGGIVQDLDSVVRCGGRWIGALLVVTGTALLDTALVALGPTDVGVVEPASDGLGRPAWLPFRSCGTETAAASTRAQPAAPTATWRDLRRRACWRIRSSAWGGG